MKKYLVYLLFPLLFSSAAWAAAVPGKSAQSEIIYRVHLGRANDVELLLKQGAKPNQTDGEGVPLLALAASRIDGEGPAIIDVLIKAGADINQRDAMGQTALFHAARVNNAGTTKKLLEHGIDYYIVDNNGDVARNIAHAQGHIELLDLMDKFVVEQSKKITKQYEERNRKLETQSKEQKKLVEEYERKVKDAMRLSAEEARTLQELKEAEYMAALAEMERLKEERRKAIIKKRNSKSFEDNLFILSFQMCGFQYWSYGKAMRHSTEIKGEALDKTIQAHYDNVLLVNKLLHTEYALQQDYTNGVIQRAQARIFYELDSMPSKTYRFEQGFGKIKDMEKRCGRIAGLWNVALSPQEAALVSSPKKRRGYKGKRKGKGKKKRK